MEEPLKQRLVGAVVLVALAVVFVPMLLDNSEPSLPAVISEPIPKKPERLAQQPEIKLDEQHYEPPAVTSAPTTESSPSASPERVAIPIQASTDPIAATPTPPQKTITRKDAGKQAADSERRSKPTPLPRATPAPTKPRTGRDGSWTIQFGSFSREENAKALQGRLRDRGFAAVVERVSGGRSVVYRVRLGAESSRSGAQSALDRVTAATGLTGVIVRYP
jgi:DedD protein